MAAKPAGFAAGIKVGKWFKRRPTVRNVFTSIRIQIDKVILLHVHDILYSLVFISD